jgi:CIC family chloride channel protein
VLVLKRSILTEKVARRGYHLSREYSVDPLEILFARDVMSTNLVAFPSDGTLEQARAVLNNNHRPRGQYLYPVVGRNHELRGVITRSDSQKWMADAEPAGTTLVTTLEELAADPVVAYPDEPLRVVVYRMAETGLTRFPVVERGPERKLVGMIGLRDLLSARTRNLAEERDRERVLRVRLPSLRKGYRAAQPVIF